MAKTSKPSPIRAGSQRAEVYNEGLCVYLHDEGHGPRLREMLESGKFGKASPDEVFFENLSVPEFAAAVVKKRLALAYELRQDDEVVADVAVGPPLTEAELAVACWHEPQRAKLHLPTGKLRIDTPNTMPLDPEEHEDEGAVVEVPPGEYVVSLYRIDWDEMRRQEKKKYKGPQEFILLTPAAEAKKLKYTHPVLPYPEPVENRDWVGAYRIDGSTIACQVNFWDFWEWFRVNLDPAGVKQAGLGVGSVLRVEAGKTTIDAVFIDDWEKDDFLAQYGTEKFDAAIAERPEVAIGGWSAFGERQILGFFRYKAGKAVAEKFHETWTPGTATILPEKFALPQVPKVEPAQVAGDAVHARVVQVSSGALVINATVALLRKLGAQPGAILEVALPKAKHAIAYGTPDEKQRHVLLKGNLSDFQLTLLKKMKMHFFVPHNVKLKADEQQDMIQTPLARGEAQPLFGSFPAATSNPLSQFLQLEPTYIDGDAGKFLWAAPPEVGAAVAVRLRA